MNEKYDNLTWLYCEVIRLDQEDMEKYWVVREQFVEALRDASYDFDFLTSLNTEQLIQFFAWCSTYRPRAPHIILAIFSKLHEQCSGLP